MSGGDEAIRSVPAVIPDGAKATSRDPVLPLVRECQRHCEKRQRRSHPVFFDGVWIVASASPPRKDGLGERQAKAPRKQVEQNEGWRGAAIDAAYAWVIGKKRPLRFTTPRTTMDSTLCCLRKLDSRPLLWRIAEPAGARLPSGAFDCMRDHPAQPKPESPHSRHRPSPTSRTVRSGTHRMKVGSIIGIYSGLSSRAIGARKVVAAKFCFDGHAAAKTLVLTLHRFGRSDQFPSATHAGKRGIASSIVKHEIE